MVPFLLVLLLSKKVKEGNLNPPEKLISFIEVVINNVYMIVPLVVIVAFGISYFLSIRIYRKKE